MCGSTCTSGCAAISGVLPLSAVSEADDALERDDLDAAWTGANATAAGPMFHVVPRRSSSCAHAWLVPKLGIGEVRVPEPTDLLCPASGHPELLQHPRPHAGGLGEGSLQRG